MLKYSKLPLGHDVIRQNVVAPCKQKSYPIYVVKMSETNYH